MSKHRDYVFTINNFTEAHQEELRNLSTSPQVRYLVFGREVGEQGTPHLQGYIYFHNAVRISTLQKKLPSGHWNQVAKGTAEENRSYCTKDEAFEEFGDLPKQGTRTDLTAFVESVKETKPTQHELCESTLYMRYPRHCDMVIDLYHKPQPLDKLDNFWFYGATGLGKSRSARQDNPDAYIKSANKWFDSYAGQACIIIDDLDQTHSYLSRYIKIWGDHYPFPAEYKGGSRIIRPSRIIITSNYHPSEIFPQADIDPILRRFTLKEFQ